MSNIETNVDALIAGIETYSKTSLELIKLQAAEKAAQLLADFLSRMLLVPVLLLLAFSLTIAGGIIIGELLGEVYLGFLILTLFYVAIAAIVLIALPGIKSNLNDSIIKKILK